MLPTLDSLAQSLASGSISAERLLQETLAKRDDPANQYVFTCDTRESALQQALQADRLRTAGQAPSPWAGIPITVKDLFDIQGLTTTAGSKALADEPAATKTAPCIQRLIDAGFVVIGRTTMTEFAYSGLGLNPHYGTPVNPYSAGEALIPGGSTSGGAVSVASGLVPATIGTDTGGSVRIPAAFCNLVGFKPGTEQVSCEGAIPLAQSLDSVGPLANSVACCAALYSVMSHQPEILRDVLNPPEPARLRVLVPANAAVWQAASSDVVTRCKEALTRLEAAGVELVAADTQLFDDILESGVQGAIAGFESSRWHRSLLERKGALYDPRVSMRIQNGAAIEEPAYNKALEQRGQFIERYRELLHTFDAVVWPTTACAAPAFSALEADADYGRWNLEVLRNTSVGNVLNAAALTLPLPRSLQAGKPPLPAGLMLLHISDKAPHLLGVAAALESVVRNA